MSTPSDILDGPGAIFEAVEIFNVSQRTTIAVTALLAYSHLLSFHREIDHIWRDLRSPASWLYIFIRYPGLLFQLIAVSLNSYTPDCNAINRLDDWSCVIAMAASYAFQLIRTYAACDRNTKLGLALVVLCLPAMSAVMYQAVVDSCESQGIAPAVLNIQVVGDMVFESVVLLATTWKTWSLAWSYSLMEMPADRSLRVSEIILRNGTFYFGVVFALTLAQLVSGNVSQTFATSLVWQMINAAILPVRWILLSQFILDLRERASNSPGASNVQTPELSAFHATLVFVQDAVEADFGEPLYPPRTFPLIDDSDELEQQGTFSHTEGLNTQNDIPLTLVSGKELVAMEC